MTTAATRSANPPTAELEAQENAPYSNSTPLSGALRDGNDVDKGGEPARGNAPLRRTTRTHCPSKKMAEADSDCTASGRVGRSTAVSKPGAAREFGFNAHPDDMSNVQEDTSKKEDNMLLSLAAILHHGAPANADPRLVDSVAKEDASWLPSTSVLYDCGGTDAAPAFRIQDRGAEARKGFKTGTSVGAGQASSLPPMPGMPARSSPCPPTNAATTLAAAYPADRSGAQVVQYAAPQQPASAGEGGCFHCPHCSKAITAADIARSTAEQYFLRNGTQGAHTSTASVPAQQPELAIGHPVLFDSTMSLQHGAASHTATKVSNAAMPQTDISHPVMPDTCMMVSVDATEARVQNASAAPESGKRGKRVPNQRPRHIVHVGSELKDAVTRLTAMLPTSGPVAETLQPLLDNSTRQYDAVYSARVTNEDFARAMNEAIHRIGNSEEGRMRLQRIVQALKGHPDLQKPKRPARTTYAADKLAATGEHAPALAKFRNKRPDKNTGSTPVLGRDSEEPQLAFRREYGSRNAFTELVQFVLEDSAMPISQSPSTSTRSSASVQEKNLILWVGIFCLLDIALLQCSLAGGMAALAEVHKYFLDWVLPSRLHYIVELLPNLPDGSVMN